MENNAYLVIEIQHYHTNMNGLAFHVGIMLLNESMNSLKYKIKKNFITRLKYAEHKIFCICIEVYKIYEIVIMIKYTKSYPH